MSREPVSTDRAPTSAHYAQAVRAAGLIFVSGQGPFDPATGAIIGATIQDQVRQCLTNIQAILEAAGTSIEKIVSSTFILGDPADLAGLNEEWDRWFSASPPARQGAKLPLDAPGLRVSIAAIAEA